MNIQKSNKSISLIIIWILAFFFWDLIQIHDQNLSTEIQHDFPILKTSLLPNLMGGIFMGLNFLLVSWFLQRNSSYFRKMSYGKLILIYSLIHFSSFSIIVVACSLLFSSFIQLFYGIELIPDLKTLLNSTMVFKITLYTYLISLSIYFIQIIDQKFGPGVLRDLILGKYRKPKERKMIFLFMDLKSSTKYAEQLGHFQYSKLIQDCFADLSKIIKQHKAQIYQYVGDEVVLIWPYETGISNLNCIQAFYAYKELLACRSDYYLKNYGLLPEFKAGINGGLLIAAEVGFVKRSIAYHGDVINIASRIQHLCNHFQQEILISKNILQDLPANKQFCYSFIDHCKLKGKKQRVSIYTINHI